MHCMRDMNRKALLRIRSIRATKRSSSLLVSISPDVTQLPVTQRNFKLSSFSVMAASFSSVPENCNNKWYYSRAQIDNNPSRRAGLDPDKELSYRQQAANLLQDMGQRLNVYLLSERTARAAANRVAGWRS